MIRLFTFIWQLRKSNFTKALITIHYLFIISFISNCKKNENIDIELINKIRLNSYDDEGEFDIYLEKFYRDMNFYGVYPQKPKKTIIKFSKLDELKGTTHIHGLSLGYNNDELIEIYINPSTWKKFNKPLKYWLMYHELSHDVLNLEDLEQSTINDGKLMFPNLESYEKKTMEEFIESYLNLIELNFKKQ